MKFSSTNPSYEKVRKVQRKNELCKNEVDIFNKFLLLRSCFLSSFGELLRVFSLMFPCTCFSEVDMSFWFSVFLVVLYLAALCRVRSQHGHLVGLAGCGASWCSCQGWPLLLRMGGVTQGSWWPHRPGP